MTNSTIESLEARIERLESFAALVVDTLMQMISDSELATEDRLYLERRIREMVAALNSPLPVSKSTS